MPCRSGFVYFVGKMQIDQNLGDSVGQLGNVAIDGRAVLAPFSGRDRRRVPAHRQTFRRGARRLGDGRVRRLRPRRRRGAPARRGRRGSPRMSSSSPAAIRAGWARRRALAEGAGAAVIDINMGCPAKHVTGGYAGSALMRDLDLARRLDRRDRRGRARCRSRSRCGSAGTRIRLNAPELARPGARAGVAAVTVHGRTRQQFYKGARRLGRASPRSWRGRCAIPVDRQRRRRASAEDAAACLTPSGRRRRDDRPRRRSAGPGSSGRSRPPSPADARREPLRRREDREPPSSITRGCCRSSGAISACAMPASTSPPTPTRRARPAARGRRDRAR